ncbi:hypothetical protein ROHU_000375 [Labeo rohita]|uniref:Uncharacterized protein n=1 Tax=Labeo rohita TaxID=84645 RepID=A0A498P6E0_LABRO|nr:hypothetical protein ROHU_000375 [Labeo rohita]
MGQRLLCSVCFRVADGLDRVQTSSGTEKRNDLMLQNSGETCVQSDLQENHFSGMAMLSRIPWRRLQRG